MNYPSCIKVPISKTDISPENSNVSSNGFPDKLSSTTYDDLITIADEIFGTGKWSHAVTSQTVDFVEYVMGKYHIGCAAFVRVELPDKTFHEEMGYSNAESSVKGLAVYSARASSITNALKKALLCFGGVIETKMIEYSSSNNKKKLKTDNDECQSEKLKNVDVIKQSAINSTLQQPKSPNAIESERNTIMTNAPQQQQQQQQQQQTINAIVKNGENEQQVGRPMNDEEMRIERKRKQREKQEEYRRFMMKEKESKVEEKTNTKF